MNILIANVGNIRAKEICTLADTLVKKHKVTIACMAIESSIKGQAFSFSGMPVRVSETSYNGMPAYEFYSTPADAVSIMLGEIMAHNRPDIVICGINNGIHMGQDIYCSSNIGMAMEAAYFRVPSVCVGIERRPGGHTAEECANAVKFLEKNIDTIAALPLPTHTFLNINIPTVANYSDLKGIKFTRQSKLDLINRFEERTDVKGAKYYWAENIERKGENVEGTGIWAFENGFIAITPVNYDASDYGRLERLEEACREQRRRSVSKRKVKKG